MVISLSLLLYIYYAFVAVWLIFSLICAYHLLRFSINNFVGFFTTFIFIAVSILIIFVSNNYINQIDWSLNFSLPGGSFFNF